MCTISIFKGRVLISGISPNGAAGKDSRLKYGDQIVSVCDLFFSLIPNCTSLVFLKLGFCESCNC